MTKQELEQQKQMLVSELNKVQQKINDYGLLDIAYDSGPFRDLLVYRQSIELKIKEIKKLLDDN